MEGNNATQDQYLLMDDDGTIISNGQVQYVTELGRVKGEEGVPGGEEGQQLQQYYVDTSRAHILSGEGLLLQHGESDHVFTNELFLHTQTSSTIQIIDEMHDDRMEVENSEAELDNTDNCTQVTLSEEQCGLLEQKGRVVLQLEDKVYLLDALGLRDITLDHELIEALRDEMYQDRSFDTKVIETQESSGLVSKQAVMEETANTGSYTSESLSQINTLDVTNVIIKDKDAEFTDVKKETPQDQVVMLECLSKYPKVITGVACLKPNIEAEPETTASINQTHKEIEQPSSTPFISSGLSAASAKNIIPQAITKRIPIQRKFVKNEFKTSEKIATTDQNTPATVKCIDERIIQLKVDYNADEIPKRIFIGYTENGKKLFANVVDVKRNIEKDTATPDFNTVKGKFTKSLLSPNVNSKAGANGQVGDESVKSGRAATGVIKSAKSLDSGGVPLEVRCMLSSGAWEPEQRRVVDKARNQLWWEPSRQPKHVARAASTVAALLAQPTLKPLLTGQPLIITTMAHNMGGGVEDGKETRTLGPAVLGRVELVNDTWTFALDQSDFQQGLPEGQEGDDAKCGLSWRLHVHVTDTTQGTLPPATTVTILRTKLPMRQIEQNDSTHAAISCEPMFATEEHLVNHQKIHDVKAELSNRVSSPKILSKSNLKISSSSPFALCQSKKNICTFCKKTFDRPFNLHRHIATHCVKETTKPQALPGSDIQHQSSKKGRYFCNICSCSYNFSSTLFRHILAQHITSTL